MLIMPVIALFYTENQLTKFDIYLLQAIYSVSVAVMEIPSGYLADIVGRKKTLILGAILGTAGFVIYSFSHGFTGFLTAEIILGLGGSFISGADSAMLFDSLASLRRKHRYLQFEGRLIAIGSFAETIAAFCGGVIAAFLSYRSVYVAQTFVAALAIPAALLLVEPPRDKTAEHPGFRHILSVCKNSILVNRKLASTIFLSSITGVATLCMAWTSQIYFVAHKLTELTITPLWIALNLTVAVVSACSAATHRFLGKTVSLLLVTVFIPAAYILLGILPFLGGITILFLFYAVRGYATPVLKDLVNQNCDSSVRATVLSIRNLIIRLSFAILGPFIGWVAELSTLATALASAGVLLLLLSVTSTIFLLRHNS
ncbi:MFS transporter [Desulforhopalus singaporensis]|nr:MFS transporter [Desulforhopalus singaporensis]